MKILLVLRHGKSSWADPGQIDHDRPLKKRGKRDALRVAQLISAHGLVPDVVISSTALRAKDTAERVAAVWQDAARPIRYDRNLYHAGPDAIVDVLRGVRPSTAGTVMIVGHNPGLEELVEVLTGEAETLPTAALAHITLGIDQWDKLRPRVRGMLVNLWCPKELADA